MAANLKKSTKLAILLLFIYDTQTGFLRIGGKLRFS